MFFFWDVMKFNVFFLMFFAMVFEYFLRLFYLGSTGVFVLGKKAGGLTVGSLQKCFSVFLPQGFVCSFWAVKNTGHPKKSIW